MKISTEEQEEKCFKQTHQQTLNDILDSSHLQDLLFDFVSNFQLEKFTSDHTAYHLLATQEISKKCFPQEK